MGCGSSVEPPKDKEKAQTAVVPGGSPKHKKSNNKPKEAVMGRPSQVQHSQHERETAAVKIQHAVRKHHRRKSQKADDLKRSQTEATGAGKPAGPTSPTAAAGTSSGGGEVKRSTTGPAPGASPSEVKRALAVDQSGPQRTKTIEQLGSGKSVLNATELKALWREVDKNGDGFLTKKELLALAMTINNQILDAFRAAQRKQHPSWTPAKIEKVVQQERAYLLPQGKDSGVSEMAHKLVARLDINHDGKVSEREFYMQFNAFSQETFESIGAPKSNGDLGCSIM